MEERTNETSLIEDECYCCLLQLRGLYRHNQISIKRRSCPDLSHSYFFTHLSLMSLLATMVARL